jgi:hypothetical protein
MAGTPLGTLGRLRAGLTGIALAVPGVSALTTALSAVGGVVAGISAPVVATLAAIAAAGYTIWRYWDRLTAVFSGVGQAIGEALRPAIEALRPLLEPLSPILETVSTAFGAVRDAVSGAVEAITGLFSSGLFSREVLSEEEQSRIAENARALTARIIAGFAALPTRLFEVGQQAIQSLWDGMVERFTAFLEWVGGIPDRILGRIGNINLSGVFGGGGQPSEGSSSRLAARARGGPISRGATYLTGERGPELITASRSGYVHPSGQGPGGRPIEISVNAPITITGAGADPERIAAEVTRRLGEEVRQTFRGVFADTGMRIA